MFRRCKPTSLAIGPTYLLAVRGEVGSPTQAHNCAYAQVKLHCSHRQVTTAKLKLIAQRWQIMNDRYQELAREAGLLVHNPDKMPTKLGVFAELLVQECIKLIENEAEQYAEPVWAVELVNDIKEHFGVTQ